MSFGDTPAAGAAAGSTTVQTTTRHNHGDDDMFVEETPSPVSFNVLKFDNV